MKKLVFGIWIGMAILNLHCSTKRDSSYPIEPVSFTEVTITDDFWSGRIETNQKVTIPFAFLKSEETGRIENFKVAGGLTEGTFNTRRGYDDSDVYKVMEGAAYSLIDHPDPALEAYLDSLISYIAAAQEDDGYLYTLRTIMQDEPKTGAFYEQDLEYPRWLGVEKGSHELYNIGHMYEAAVAHYQATGKRNFLDIALKSADLVCDTFGWGKLALFPGHQEIEIGLVKLYHVTGEQKYLDMAKTFLDFRGQTETKWTYNQSHMPVVEQDEAVGHAVRALYMYAGMADIAALTGNNDYLTAMDKLWHNIVDYQLYITGGVGAPGGNEGFAGRYELDNHNAYCETCAAVANAFWNYRLFLTLGEAKYMDVLERSLYNNILSGVSLSGDRFFYPNRLESRGDQARSEWFSTSCCPSNISRFLPSVPGYIYAKAEGEIYVNLLISSETNIDMGKGKVQISQESGIPWNGKVKLTIAPEKPSAFALKLRIPGWASEEAVPSDLYRFTKPLSKTLQVSLNGQKADYRMENGYLVVERKWEGRSSLEVDFPYEVRMIAAHDSVAANQDKIALQAGPLVYCAEWPDQETKTVLDLMIDTTAGFSFTEAPFEGAGNAILGEAFSLSEKADGQVEKQAVKFKAIPYYAWAHRGKGEMAVWLPLYK